MRCHEQVYAEMTALRTPVSRIVFRRSALDKLVRWEHTLVAPFLHGMDKAKKIHHVWVPILWPDTSKEVSDMEHFQSNTATVRANLTRAMAAEG